MVTDPIADLLTRIRNGLAVKLETINVNYSVMKQNIIKILKEEGYIKNFEIVNLERQKKNIKIILKYDKNGNSLIKKIKTISSPGKRVYIKKADIRKVLNGYGINIFSTSKGIMTGRGARLNNLGGELLCDIY